MVRASLVGLGVTLTLLGSQLVPDALNVLQFGADKTGRVDATNAFQTALDAAATPGGGTVWVPRGKYLFRGNLRVPAGGTLKGSWNSVPSHIGLRNPGFPKPGEGGTTLLVTANAGKSDGPAFLTLSHNATVQGVVIFYPEQTPSPKPYPFAIASKAKNPAILDVELLNPYQGIEMNGAERPLIRNVTGQPLRIGVLTDGITDIGDDASHALVRTHAGGLILRRSMPAIDFPGVRRLLHPTTDRVEIFAELFDIESIGDIF